MPVCGPHSFLSVIKFVIYFKQCGSPAVELNVWFVTLQSVHCCLHLFQLFLNSAVYITAFIGKFYCHKVVEGCRKCPSQMCPMFSRSCHKYYQSEQTLLQSHAKVYIDASAHVHQNLFHRSSSI